jgi:hypothetical protein
MPEGADGASGEAGAPTVGSVIVGMVTVGRVGAVLVGVVMPGAAGAESEAGGVTPSADAAAGVAADGGSN